MHNLTWTITRLLVPTTYFKGEGYVRIEMAALSRENNGFGFTAG